MSQKQDVQLAQRAFATGNEYLIAIAQAMLSVLHNIKPEKKDLGYFLAEHEKDRQTDEEHLILYELLRRFCVSEFIFNNTTYDEYMGGHYFRRS